MDLSSVLESRSVRGAVLFGEEHATPEERKEYIEFSKTLKKIFERLTHMKFRTSVSKTKLKNPYIEIRLKGWEPGGESIPNELRAEIAKRLGFSGIRDWEDVVYGNISRNMIALKYHEWKEVEPFIT